MQNHRGEWSSKLGFILAASGSAIGLGNIWRYPYIVGKNGGAAFVVIYLLIVVIIGLPYMLGELSLGRSSQKNPVGAIDAIKPGSAWKGVGYLGVLTGLGILSFYGVIAGWTVGYIFKMITGNPGDFAIFISNSVWVILLFAFFIFITAAIVHGGISGGIERWSKILMPVLFVLMIILIIYAVSLPGSGAGLRFYLMPDFSKIDGNVILAALGQAFFSLSLGMGLMITYGSYVPKSEDLFTSAGYIVFFDSLIAFMAGLIIFPALFANGQDPEAGAKLVFVVFPELFMRMPAGTLVGAIFFLLLSVAALTSTISLLEVPVAFLIDEKKVHRKRIVWIIAGIAFLLGLPSALSQGASPFFTNFGLIPQRLADPDFLSQMSFVFGDLSLAIGALLLSIFIGWIWGAKFAASEIEMGSSYFKKFLKLWIFMMRYIIPISIFIILLNLFGIFN
ncbi:MAG: sodium-dependent transporter [Caldisericaceae bacterium]|nr:sodium-dependent transporter [Caldisericaceae bacterium]